MIKPRTTPDDSVPPARLRWIKPALWIMLPLVGVMGLLGVVLSKQQASPGPIALQTVSPTRAQSPALVTPTPTASPTPKKTPLQTAKKPLKPVDPSAYTAQQKAINQQAKQEFTALSSSVDALIEMHVAIAEGLPSVTVGAPHGAALLDPKGRVLHQLPPGASYEAQVEGDGIRFGDWKVPSIVWIDVVPGEVLQLGQRTYRGRLLLAADGPKLWGVNYINMRQYLYSVVASEVSPSWNMAALKAQAVAARSYALTYYFKPVSSLFHLGATEYYQVYSGVEREASRTNEAVDATAGEFVSYRGGIVESLYAASDDIVAEAFQGKGMSQLGALALGAQGYTYKQILSNYYPRTGVARIEEDKD